MILILIVNVRNLVNRVEQTGLDTQVILIRELNKLIYMSCLLESVEIAGILIRPV